MRSASSESTIRRRPSRRPDTRRMRASAARPGWSACGGHGPRLPRPSGVRRRVAPHRPLCEAVPPDQRGPAPWQPDHVPGWVGGVEVFGDDHVEHRVAQQLGLRWSGFLPASALPATRAVSQRTSRASRQRTGSDAAPPVRRGRRWPLSPVAPRRSRRVATVRRSCSPRRRSEPPCARRTPLERLDQLDQRQRVGVEVVEEGITFGDVGRLDLENVGQPALDQLQDLRPRHRALRNVGLRRHGCGLLSTPGAPGGTPQGERILPGDRACDLRDDARRRQLLRHADGAGDRLGARGAVRDGAHAPDTQQDRAGRVERSYRPEGGEEQFGAARARGAVARAIAPRR